MTAFVSIARLFINVPVNVDRLRLLLLSSLLPTLKESLSFPSWSVHSLDRSCATFKVGEPLMQAALGLGCHSVTTWLSIKGAVFEVRVTILVLTSSLSSRMAGELLDILARWKSHKFRTSDIPFDIGVESLQHGPELIEAKRTGAVEWGVCSSPFFSHSISRF